MRSYLPAAPAPPALRRGRLLAAHPDGQPFCYKGALTDVEAMAETFASECEQRFDVPKSYTLEVSGPVLATSRRSRAEPEAIQSMLLQKDMFAAQNYIDSRRAAKLHRLYTECGVRTFADMLALGSWSLFSALGERVEPNTNLYVMHAQRLVLRRTGYAMREHPATPTELRQYYSNVDQLPTALAVNMLPEPVLPDLRIDYTHLRTLADWQKESAIGMAFKTAPDSFEDRIRQLQYLRQVGRTLFQKVVGPFEADHPEGDVIVSRLPMTQDQLERTTLRAWHLEWGGSLNVQENVRILNALGRIGVITFGDLYHRGIQGVFEATQRTRTEMGPRRREVLCKAVSYTTGHPLA